jgi:hypothetical protein
MDRCPKALLCVAFPQSWCQSALPLPVEAEELTASGLAVRLLQVAAKAARWRVLPELPQALEWQVLLVAHKKPLGLVEVWAMEVALELVKELLE